MASDSSGAASVISVITEDTVSFEYLWERSFSSRPRRSSSPAVFASGLLAIGAEDRQLRVYNAQTGVELWHRNLGGPIVGTPASFGRQIFVTTLYSR
jgi:outer membrane protein assembly factor BamB